MDRVDAWESKITEVVAGPRRSCLRRRESRGVSLGDVAAGMDRHRSAATVGMAHDVVAASGSCDLEASSF